MYIRLLVLAAAAAVGAAAFASPAYGAVMPAKDAIPEGIIWPTIAEAELLSPQPHNRLLEADLVVAASDESTVARYEYRWNGDSRGDPHALADDSPSVTYRTISPNTRYELDVRVVDTNRNVSDWHTVWTGTTPGAPHVIVAGDSVASGYTREWFTGPASCVDESYSYGNALVSEIAAGLPTQWSPTYLNIAWAGAGLEDMVNGGSDSCGTSHPPQIDQIRDTASDGTWNVIAVTAGINSTNWTDVVVDLTKDATLSLTSAGDKSVCGSALRDHWNIADRRDFVADATASVSRAITSDTNAQVLWTGYYDITDTELAPLWRPITGSCSDEMGNALDTLHGALRDGLDERVTWVDIDRSISTQQWAGWPHPDSQGQRAIGHRIALALNS